MSLTISYDLIQHTTHERFKHHRMSGGSFRDRKVDVDTGHLDTVALDDLINAAGIAKDSRTGRALEAIRLARKGKFETAVPNYKAFQGMLQAFLSMNAIDGWIYVTGADGKLYPYLATSVVSRNHKDDQRVILHATAYSIASSGGRESMGVQQCSFSFGPKDVAKRRLADILASKGIYKETQALRDEHAATLTRHHNVTRDAFARQFRFAGLIHQGDDRESRGVMVQSKVIHDLEPTDYRAGKHYAESFVFADDGRDDSGAGHVPEHPLVRVFDLRTHRFYWVHADFLTPYEYDKSLRDKLILPDTHRDLLDVLTSDLDVFVNDIIEGKSAGNVILCKGPPGVGKTLTAEVYAELTERPLYAIHSGSLGTRAPDIQKKLQEVFQRSNRWGCVLLLDECDVFVAKRGANIEQNAIVAEFLRTLEYFDGLLFMTTNRPNDIDDGILSRCAAIIDYDVPTPAHAAAIWRVMAAQYETELSQDLIDQLVQLFPGIAARDIKMLFRLTLRMARSANQPLHLDTFRVCAMFRAIKMAERPALAEAA